MARCNIFCNLYECGQRSIHLDERIDVAIQALANEDVQRSAVVDDHHHLIGAITGTLLFSAIDGIDSKGTSVSVGRSQWQPHKKCSPG